MWTTPGLPSPLLGDTRMVQSLRSAISLVGQALHRHRHHVRMDPDANQESSRARSSHGPCHDNKRCFTSNVGSQQPTMTHRFSWKQSILQSENPCVWSHPEAQLHSDTALQTGIGSLLLLFIAPPVLEPGRHHPPKKDKTITAQDGVFTRAHTYMLVLWCSIHSHIHLVPTQSCTYL